MPPVAPATVGTPTEQDENHQTAGWSEFGADSMRFHGDGLDTGVRIMGDGRFDINISEHKSSIAGLLNQLQRTASRRELEQIHGARGTRPRPDGKYFPLHLNIVIQVIGSRGDIQPFLAVGKELKAHGHRVRLATHLAFRDSVLDEGLEFFNIGGDPAELMAFMVKNPGLIPNVSTIRSGAIQKRRRDIRQIIDGCWRSCHETGDGTHLHQIKEDPWSDELDYRRRPFVADAIIANPPSLAHIHCAQRLGIPLHIMFTMPWSPTQFFPHPLATINHQECKPTVANFVSYAIVDMMVWEGLGDIINTFRKRTLALDPLDAITAPSLIQRLKVPCSYLWSPAVLPKPNDWGDHIDICGFSFLPSKPDYEPPERIDRFLKAGPTPIYVGFGSIVVDDPVRLTRTVFEAISKAGQRAIVSKGWGNLGVDGVEVPDGILVVESVPHDWLFRHVSCVVHHGGAGTTAAGLALGCPTIIVPFFGDQQFWGEIVARAGAGPTPIPHKQLTVEKLTAAIEMALDDSTRERAREIAQKMAKESGVRDAVCSFHRQLDLRRLRCAICQTRPAVWHLKHTEIGLSAFAATVLVEMGRVNPENFVLYRATEYDTYRDPVGPISAGAQVIYGTITSVVTGLADVPADMVVDLVSAGRALGQTHPRLDPLKKWHKHKSHGTAPESDKKEDNDETKDRPLERMQHEQPKVRRDNFGDEERGDDGIPQGMHEDESEDESEDGSGDEAESSDDIETHIDSLSPTGGIDRRRSLQLEKSESMSSEVAPSKPYKLFLEVVHFGGKVSKKFVNFIIWPPTDLFLSLSKGFHNAPKLYRDPMVQDVPTVIGFRSGFRAAGKELRDGLYYGITGLVTQPRYGYKHKGTKGMLKGVGKGLGGVFFKPPAGVWGLVGYPLTGIRRYLLDSLGKSERSRIVISRIAQGHEEMQASSEAERAEVVRKWSLIEESLQKADRRCLRHARPLGRHTNGIIA